MEKTSVVKRCQWISCNEIATELGHISLPGGPAVKVWLCKKHHEQLKQTTEKEAKKETLNFEVSM